MVLPLGKEYLSLFVQVTVVPDETPATCTHPCQASLVAQLVKNPPAIWESWARSLGWEDPLERERLPTPVFWTGEFRGLYSPWGCKESDMTE